MAHFLKDRIGGSQFDDSENINREVGQVMKLLDMNDNGLEYADVEGYWRRLESLLTAEEVSEWIVHAVQLPAEVGRIFLENGVTGYDFPEIVQNSGMVLQEELGLKSSFRSKIVRGVQARMMGIGSTPEATKTDFQLTNCRSVSLKWGKSQARIFPVHSYRIQRRAVNLFGSHERGGSDLSFSIMSISSESSADSLPATAWKTIYVGGETEYVDSTLEMGHIYMYRIQAWNSVGRSSWEYVDLERALKKKGCSKKPKKNASDSTNKVIMRGIDFDHDDESWEWFSLPKRVIWGVIFAIQFVYHSARVFFMVIAMGGAIMKFKRASATSSASAAASLPFLWFWKGINRLSVKLTGHECIPRTMLGDKEAILLQEKMHDDRVMATGLRGYSQTYSRNSSEEKQENPRENNKSDGNVVDESKADRRTAMAAAKYNSTGNLLSPDSKPPREITLSKSTTKKFGGWNRNYCKKSDSSGCLSSDNDSIAISPKNGATTTERSIQTTRPMPPLQPLAIIDDGSLCIVCQKKFKIGKRYRHHCSRCMATFCHKHGKTTHSNFTSCRVPGSCLCNPCLEQVGRGPRSSPIQAMTVT